MSVPRLPSCALGALLLIGSLPSQRAEDPVAARARDVLSYLASDRLGGRDSPSPGQDEAAEYLAAAFAKAGLQPGVPGADAPGWFHRYTLPGLAFDTAGATLAVTVDGERDELAPGDDFRIWECGRPVDAQDLEVDLGAPDADADPREVRRDMAGRRVRFLEVAADDPAWLAARGGRQVLSGRAAGGAPVVLLCAGVVPTTGARADLNVPAPQKVDVALRNVVAVLPGTDLADEYVVVSAHYDHVGIRPSSGGGDQVYNGADDDATGTTAVLLLAEHFAQRVEPLRRSVAFVCFSAEEKGLRGSHAFCEDPPFPLEKIAADLNLEMLGRPEEGRSSYAWITGAELSDLAAISKPILESRGVALIDFGMGPQLFFGSDNLSFAHKGVVAHSFSAGTLHRDYHKPTDEVGKIAIDHMTAVIRGLEGVVREFATRDARPRYTEAALRQLKR